MERKAILGVPWTVVSFAANKGVTTATTLVLARLLAPADFGVMAVAGMVVNFLYWFGGLSFAGTVVVRQDLDARGLGTTLTLMLGSGLVVALIAAGASPLIAAAFGTGRVTGVLIALAGGFVVASFNGFYDSMFQRELEFRRRFAALAFQTVSYAALAIGGAVLGAGVWSLVIGQLGASLIWAGALLALSPVRVRPAFDPAVARSVIVSGRGFLAQGVTLFVRQNADNVTVGHAFGPAALGFYSMGYRLGDLSYWAIADPVARVTFPAFARARERGEDIRPAFLGVLRLVALIGCPVGVLLSGAAEPFTRAVLGPRWLPMAAPLAVLGIWAALRPIDSTLSWLLNSIGRADAAAWLSLAILVPLVPGFILAVSIGHMTAVAVVVVLDTLVSLSAVAVIVRRHAKIPLAALWESVAPVVLASPAAWLACRLGAAAVGTRPALLALAVALLCGLAAYVVTVTVLDRTLLQHAARQLMRTLGRDPDPVSAGASGS